MKHLKDLDFKGAQLFLFGEDFGEKAKAKLETAAALKTIGPLANRSKQLGFQPSHLHKSNLGNQGGKSHNYGPGKIKKKQGQVSSSKDKWLVLEQLSTPQVSNLIKCVNPTPKLIQAQKPKHHLGMLIGQMYLPINSPKLARRPSQYVRNWERLTEDQWVLQAVPGYKLQLAQTPWQAKPAPEIQCSRRQRSQWRSGSCWPKGKEER